MGSSRLPGKILMPLAGHPVLWHVVNRLRQSKRLTNVVVATTVNPADDQVEQFCQENNIPCYRGSEEDVLDRYYRAILLYHADPVIRITADCPCIDPLIIDELIDGYVAGGYEVYGLSGEFPDGLDCEMFSYRVMFESWNNARLKSEREHVVLYPWNHPELFKQGELFKFTAMAHHRWTIDEEKDYRFLTELYNRLYREGDLFTTDDILALLEREPELAQINTGIIRNEGLIKTLEHDTEINPNESTDR